LKIRKTLNINYFYYLFIAFICSIIVSIYFSNIYEYDSLTFLDAALNSGGPTAFPGSQNYVYFLDIINTPYGLNWIIYLVNSYLLTNMIIGVKKLSLERKIEHKYLVLLTICMSPFVLFYYLQPLREIFYIYAFYILIMYYYFGLRPKIFSFLLLILSLTFHVGHTMSVSLFLLYMITRNIFDKRIWLFILLILISSGSYFLIWSGLDEIFIAYLNSSNTSARSNYSASILTPDVHQTYRLLMLNYFLIIPTASIGLLFVVIILRLTFLLPFITILISQNFRFKTNIFEVLLLQTLINLPWVMFTSNYFQALRHAAPSIILFLIIFKTNQQKSDING